MKIIFVEDTVVRINGESRLLLKGTEILTDEEDIAGAIPVREGWNSHLYKSLYEVELSYRALSALTDWRITHVWVVAMCTQAELLKIRNFGPKSLNEIKEVLHEMNLGINMNLTGFPPYEAWKASRSS